MIMSVLQPNDYIVFYNETNKYLIGNNLNFIKFKFNNKIISKNTKFNIQLNNELSNYYIDCTKNKKSILTTIKNLLLVQIKNIFFGSSIRFRINGRGYRLFSQLNHILFKLGYSHVINFTLPIQYEIQKKEKHHSFFKISSVAGLNPNLILSNIKTLRIPNVYSKKGIFKKNDFVLFKEGKKNFTL